MVDVVKFSKISLFADDCRLFKVINKAGDDSEYAKGSKWDN